MAILIGITEGELEAYQRCIGALEGLVQVVKSMALSVEVATDALDAFSKAAKEAALINPEEAEVI